MLGIMKVALGALMYHAASDWEAQGRVTLNFLLLEV